MLKEERHQHILTLLQRDGKVVSTDLCQQFATSEDTIRRDLIELEQQGRLQRVHGGAFPVQPLMENFVTRQTVHQPTKETLARATLPYLAQHQVILIDSGTTTAQVAQLLPLDMQATVITNSPPVIIALAEHPLIELVLLGGRVNKSALATVGTHTADALRQIRADVCLLGVCSVHPELGVTDVDYEEAQIKRLMIQQSKRVIAIATADKLDTAFPYYVADITALSLLVTEATLSPEQLHPYAEKGIEIVRG